MKPIILLSLLFVFSSIICYSQEVSIKGKIIDERKNEIPFANVALFFANDTTNIVKGSVSDLSCNATGNKNCKQHGCWS